MAVLVILLGLAAPSLGNFFRGRTLDSEARRFVSLTRYAESRAVSEGVPVLVWIDAQQRMYGLAEDAGVQRADPRAVEYAVGRDVQVEVLQATSTAARRGQAQAGTRLGRNALVIRFEPDGFISEGAPEAVAFRQVPRDGGKPGPAESVWVARTPNGLHYEIPTNQLAYARR